MGEGRTSERWGWGRTTRFEAEERLRDAPGIETCEDHGVGAGEPGVGDFGDEWEGLVS